MWKQIDNCSPLEKNYKEPISKKKIKIKNKNK